MNRVFLVGGLALLISGCLVGLLLISVILNLQTQVSQLTPPKLAQPGLRSLHCPTLLGLNETGRVRVQVMNPTDQDLEYQVDLKAGAFSFSNQPAVQSIGVSAGKSTQLNWNLIPTQSGEFILTVSGFSISSPSQNPSQASENLNFEAICGVRVLNLSPFTGRSVETLAVTGILGGGFFLTCWLYDRWRDRKKRGLYGAGEFE